MKQRGKRALVQAMNRSRQGGGHQFPLRWEVAWGLEVGRPEVSCWTDPNMRSTSASRRPNSIVRTDLRGWRITSTSDCNRATWWRTASRMRRLMRLRWTALPSTLPAVSPTRGPAGTGALEKPGTRAQKKYAIDGENCLRLD